MAFEFFLTSTLSYRATLFLSNIIRIHKILPVTMDPAREKALHDYRKKLLEHAEVESRLKESE